MNSRNYREKLIDEVKKYPVLYDTRHENHRDIDVRDRCWLEISEKLSTNNEVLKREWKILRDSMRQALNRSKRGSTTKNGLPCKKWRFQTRMGFLLPYMTIRRRERRIKTEDLQLDEPELEPEPEQSEAEEESGAVAEPEHLDTWDSAELQQPAPESDVDSLELFFASVCQSTKRLPRKLQASVKRQVLDALLRVEDEWESMQGDSTTDMNKDY